MGITLNQINDIIKRNKIDYTLGLRDSSSDEYKERRIKARLKQIENYKHNLVLASSCYDLVTKHLSDCEFETLEHEQYLFLENVVNKESNHLRDLLKIRAKESKLKGEQDESQKEKSNKRKEGKR